MAHVILELICASEFGQGDGAIDVVPPCCYRIIGTHDRLPLVSLVPKQLRNREKRLLKTLQKQPFYSLHTRRT
jgi:hypothetical protein